MDKISVLVRDSKGRAKFSYDPRLAPEGLLRMLTNEEISVINKFKRDFKEDVNGDPRNTFPEGRSRFSEKSRKALEIYEQTFPLYE